MFVDVPDQAVVEVIGLEAEPHRGRRGVLVVHHVGMELLRPGTVRSIDRELHRHQLLWLCAARVGGRRIGTHCVKNTHKT